MRLLIAKRALNGYIIYIRRIFLKVRQCSHPSTIGNHQIPRVQSVFVHISPYLYGSISDISGLYQSLHLSAYPILAL